METWEYGAPQRMSKARHNIGLGNLETLFWEEGLPKGDKVVNKRRGHLYLDM